MLQRHLLPALWIAWAAFWLISSRWVKKAQRKQPIASRLWQLVPLAVAAYVLTARHLPLGVLDAPWLPRAPVTYWVGVGVAAAGLAVAVWARVVLGRNWSGIVTVKEDHELVRTGPYAAVRHPIYSGILLALVGTSASIDAWRAPVAIALIGVSLWWKLRLEERWMSQTFGDRYAAYREETWALIPFVV